MNMIDWNNPTSQVTIHFTVNDCLMLHSWNELATENDGADFDKLILLCQKLEEIRNYLSCPMNIHCIFRSQEYNQHQSIKPIADVHSMSLACDFDCHPNLSCDEVKAKLLPELENLNIRMEDNGPGASWVHIDLHPVIHNRFFKP
jgi:hypothetical protein